MKILHILYSGLGGHGNVFFSMVEADPHNTYQVIFFGVENVNKEYIDKVTEKNIKWDFVKKKNKLDLSSFKQIADIVSDSKCDIIFMHSSGYILSAIFNKKKNINKKIIVRETQANNLKTKMEWLWLCAAFLLANKIIFLSEEYKNEIARKLFWLFKKRKVAVIPNGINLFTFCPANNLKSDDFIIGMQSRIVKIKDHETLLRAFALVCNESSSHKNLKLKIAGDGENKSYLEKLTYELGIENNVEFTGNLGEKELVDFLQSLNLYVHASLGETMSTALMQAMACGLPIIASDVKGINNMISNNETGILVPIKNEKLLSTAMIDCINNPSLCLSLANKGLLYAQKNFSNMRMMEEYKKEFYELTRNK